MIGWLVTSAALAWILSVKVGVRLSWDAGTARLKIRVGVFRFSVSTGEKKKQKPKGPSAPLKEKTRIKPPLKKWIKAVLHHWRDLLALVSRILHAPSLDLLRLSICVGDKDPDVCAMNYGKICAGIGAGLPVVTNLIPVRMQDVDISCDFAAAETKILAEAELTLRIWEVVVLAVACLDFLLKVYRFTKNSEKAVQPE